MEAKRCDFSRGDADALSSTIYHVLTTVEVVGGISSNMFILAVNANDGFRNRGLKPIEQILTALGISKFLYFCFIMSKVWYTTLNPWVSPFTRPYQIFTAVTWFLTCTNLFFSACLCTFYCAKIAHFQQHAFMLLKRRINQLVPWLLFLSLFASLGNTSPFFFGISRITCEENGNSSAALGNSTLVENIPLQMTRRHLFLFYGAGFSVAFSFLAMVGFLLLFSLWRHTETCLASFASPNLDAHFQAAKIIVSLLITEAVNFIALFVLLVQIFPDKSPKSWICILIALACPNLQSGILIWGNPTLKGTLLRALPCCNRRLSLP